MAISPTSTGPTQSTTPSVDSQKLSQNYQMFLKLLTTQIRNQSPMQPMNPNEFTQQLVQYSSIEQQIKMNANIEDLKVAMAMINATSLVNYIGSTVTVDSASTVLTSSSSASWTFTMPKAAKTTVVVKDSYGKVVHVAQRDFTAGEQSYSWDGRLANGTRARVGEYTISFEAKDADGRAVTPVREITGKVDGLDFVDGQAFLKINGKNVPVWSVKSVRGGS